MACNAPKKRKLDNNPLEWTVQDITELDRTEDSESFSVVDENSQLCMRTIRMIQLLAQVRCK